MARDRESLISQLVSCTAMRKFYSQLQQMPQSCHCSRLGYPYWPRLDLGVTCPSVQPIRVGLRSPPVMARSQSGCPTGRPLMRLLSRRRGRLWRYVCAVSASPASGGPAITGFHPASSESRGAPTPVQRPPSGGLCIFGSCGVMGEKSGRRGGNQTLATN
jgi:hypothetical protein